MMLKVGGLNREEWVIMDWLRKLEAIEFGIACFVKVRRAAMVRHCCRNRVGRTSDAIPWG
jgi:hypothetical protein